MLRNIRFPSALAVLLLSSGAFAAPATEVPDAVPRDAGGIVLAQGGDYDVFYDGHGNRVIVDTYTGKVVAVQPPQTRFDRRALRLRERQQRLDDGYSDDRYYLDDPEDMARFRRRQLQDEENYPSWDSGGSDGSGEFPPAPRSDDGYAGAYPDEPAPPPAVDGPPIQRQPLKEASIGPGQPDDSTAAPAPGIGSSDMGGPDIGGKAAIDSSLGLGAREDIAALQVLLDRAGASPGVIDGRFGSNVDKALVAYREITGVNLKSTDTQAIKEALAATGGDALAAYTITPEDVAGPYVASIPEDYSQKARLERMSFTSVTEALAERFHMDENYLKALNPGVNFNRPGTIVKVVNFGRLVSIPVARIVADKRKKQVFAYDAGGELVAAYPATIGSSDTPSPTGVHAVSRIAFDPNYTYNPNLNFKQGDNDKILTIPPGPNGPVGSIWIALDKPTYGIHGTPEPSKIGKTESHGCVRLTNWDAAELARLVKPGVSVEFVD
ncbi:L,D-transpeptidase family protein [Mesorhizobium sp. PUT5]|uniref:L,D-transpeptidase family protein n=1 Tax=Mesorhizobium sp. PUT5 TaxID=3454629 RepID=UPI003FA48479